MVQAVYRCNDSFLRVVLPVQFSVYQYRLPGRKVSVHLRCYANSSRFSVLLQCGKGCDLFSILVPFAYVRASHIHSTVEVARLAYTALFLFLRLIACSSCSRTSVFAQFFLLIFQFCCFFLPEMFVYSSKPLIFT